MLVAYDQAGAVATITLSRPPVNALSAELIAELDEAVARAEDDAVRAVVIAGQAHFSAGADISEFQAGFDAGGSGAGLGDRLSRLCSRVQRLAKPTIAAVRGVAMGGGLELALSCDFRYLSEDAVVGQPEIKLGLLPGAGGTQRLARLVGLRPALEIVLSGRRVEAPEAQDLGISDRIIDPDGVVSEAQAAAAEWALAPTKAIGYAKRALYEGLGLALEDGLRLESEMFAAAFDTADAREGVSAFLEKREPGFSGT